MFRTAKEIRRPSGHRVGLDLPYARIEAGKSDARAGELHKGNPFGKALDEAYVTAGIPRITPHGLRHTGNDLLRRFASREVVMAITGHSTPAMHSHYSHVDQNEKAEAVGKVIELVTKPVHTPLQDRKGV